MTRRIWPQARARGSPASSRHAGVWTTSELPVCEPNQRGAILYFRPCPARRRVILRFRQECEPADEVLTVLDTVKASAVRKAITQAVAPGGAARRYTVAERAIRACAPRAFRKHGPAAKSPARACPYNGQQSGDCKHTENLRGLLAAEWEAIVFHGFILPAHSKCGGVRVQGLPRYHAN